MVAEDTKKENMAALELSHIGGVFPMGVKAELRGASCGTLYRKNEREMVIPKSWSHR